MAIPISKIDEIQKLDILIGTDLMNMIVRQRINMKIMAGISTQITSVGVKVGIILNVFYINIITCKLSM